MDLIIVEGDDEEIEIFNDAQTLAEDKKTIVYETVTRLSPTIKRTIF
jgi:alanine racemase